MWGGYDMDRLKKVLNGVAQHKDAVLAAVVPVLLAIVFFVHGDIKGTITDAEARLAGKLDKAEGRLKAQVSGVTGELTKAEGRLKDQVSGVTGELTKAEGRLKDQVSGVTGELTKAEGRLKDQVSGVTDELAKAEGRLKEQMNGVVDELAKAEGRLKGDVQVAEFKAIDDLSGRVERIERLVTGRAVEQGKNAVGDVSKE